ncbi:MAG: outer membrane lipoprotein chaperone LolA [Limnohabitans sp.]|jgi:outer membrane lipoprotein carrier protein|uniref:outer membrane lipoprotein chaperone LolA n=1 Tax=Limnohabitans sp. TaxID=1907725 RepID=UPI0025DAB1DE|nr:outer membrane lipoprotein chaperone LolA [Limnohabitans sp.]MCO4087662.1 outer membrane lipoprotein chaperone LolA [Limnohabitans sp.]
MTIHFLSRRTWLAGWVQGLGAWTVLSLALPVQADAVDLLAQFVKLARSGRADFTQVVTSPSRVGQTPRIKTSSGSFEFQRPGKFRFDYRKPFVQTLLADGQTLWMHDIELNQVTARKQQQVLGTTPLGLLTAGSDLQSLKADFQFSPEPARDGLEWVRATPLAADGQIRAVMVGLRASPLGPELAVLDVQDNLGQRSVLTFSAFQLNPVLPASQFVFKPPVGTDILRP